MTVKEALKNRFSCRSFLDTEVPKEILEDVIRDAFHTPSCENSQPWEVYVAGKESMQKIRQAYETNRKGKISPDLNRRFDGNWTKEMEPRVDEFFNGIYEHEPHGNAEYTLQKRNLFYAPAMIFLCIHEGLPEWSVFDVGAFSQSLMLSASEHGLATIASAVSVSYPDALRGILGIPPEEKIVIGIGIGCPDPQAKINQYRTDRKSLDVVTFIP